MIKFPGSALVDGLRLFVNAAQPVDIVMHLYSAEAFVKSGAVTDYTEVSGHGYAPATIRGAMWEIGTDGDVAFAKAGEQQFRFTGQAGLVHGYYLTRGGMGPLLGAERFKGGPVFIVNNGDTIAVSPVLALRTGNV